MRYFVWISHRPDIDTCLWYSNAVTHLLLWYTSYQVHQGFTTYVVGGGRLYDKVDDIGTYLIVPLDDKTSVDAAERVMNRKGLQETVKFLLRVRVLSVITGSSSRCPLWYNYLVHSENNSYFVVIGSICNIELIYIFRPVSPLCALYWI